MIRHLPCMLTLAAICISFGPSNVAAVESELPRAVATFESLGLYWKVSEGGENKPCEVKYRIAGEDKWRDAMPLWFDERDGEYRGSIVHLKPGTEYEIELEVKGTDLRKTLRAKTWHESFPVGNRVALPARSGETLTIEQSGTPEGYILYAPESDAQGATIDVAGKQDRCIVVKGSYVIIRGLTLKNPAIHGIELTDGVHDAVIENCDISGWGRIREDGWGNDYDAAVYSRDKRIARIVVQRNRMHHPRSDSNNWRENRPRPGKSESYHPEGPQAICFWNSRGNHVFRYNTVWSDADHKYNDVFGAGSNFSTEGFPARDTDIYGNYLSYCWDDAIESEGANANVRIWGNYLTECFVGIACASTSVGPAYIWRNVMGTSAVAPGDNGGGFFKTSDKMAGGRVYVFHNTILQPPAPEGSKRISLGASIGMGWGGPIVNTVSRNNIFNVTGRMINDRKPDPRNDFDYDLYSGRPPKEGNYEKHGIQGTPVYAYAKSATEGTGTANAGRAGMGTGYSIPRETAGASKNSQGNELPVPVLHNGNFALAPNSPGFDAALPIPNFNDNYNGAAPDIGAHEAGTPPMRFGAEAYRR